MIKCDDYDYVEIVCLFQYPIKLVLRTGDTIEGIAKDTARNADREECISLETSRDQQRATELVVLDHIASLEVLVDNPHFKQISFS
ncbi:Rho-binding antiterminator [Enterovibrio calviensis]|uniref:Rho-binding antiterminator n=1 Tax=Enterovibrio calviensis TaxID=91359 RepID=UPI000480C9F9|nr:Rho-binding antiterminator [Enterovibrio calviensis]